MLVKEYRILLPLTTEEYRIAQLFMIQKKSRLESSGAGSGVEIIKNEPFQHGPGEDESGQYTYKIYHIGNRIPMWIRNVLPSSALEAHEEAWNAYPYTRTRYSCPLISHFSVDVETRYLNDAGTTENVFNLSKEELKNRTIEFSDIIDFVRDQISTHDYFPEEDPKLYRSEKTGRGPLTDNWVEECQRQAKPVMCAYKLCKVEFKYWGLQTRAERWIHELALRNTMLRAHRQAWAWQDEWFGLSIEDIRQLENETQQYLSALMTGKEESGNGLTSADFVKTPFGTEMSIDEEDEEEEEEEGDGNEHGKRMDPSSSSSDIFFDCSDRMVVDDTREHKPTLVRWSSELLVNEDELEKSPPHTPRSYGRSLLVLVFHGDLFPKTSADSKITDTHTLRTTLETLICGHYSQLKNRVHVHCVTCGSELGPIAHQLNGLCSSFGTFHPSLGPLLASDRQRFREAIAATVGNANRAVRAFLGSEAGRKFDPDEGDEIFVVGDFVGGILMYEALAKTAAHFSSSSSGQQNEVENGTIHHRHHKRQNHLNSPIRMNSHPVTISGQSSPCAPSARAIKESSRSVHSLSAGPTIEHHHQSQAGPSQIFNFEQRRHLQESDPDFTKQKSAPPSACRQASTDSTFHPRTSSLQKNPIMMHSNEEFLCFRPSCAFLLGCPLALVLIQRKLTEPDQSSLVLACDQLYNLYYTLDLCAARLEPVLNPTLALLPSPKVPRYQRFHLQQQGGGGVFGDEHDDHFDNNALLETPMIWGSRRVDHELYCPPEMSSLPALALPSILHASYWESKDLSSFILRQFLRFDHEAVPCPILTLRNLADQPPLQFQMPLTVWNRRRTRFKVANLASNHRANDLIVVDGAEQVISARFCYGPMDLVVLSQENVLVYVLPSGGEWFLKGVETTDKHGRLTINLGKTLPIGIHHVRLIVQGDHTFLSVSIAVVPPGTPLVVFSIDGSLTASVSVTGRDPRLRPGAVDVVRFWQQQGYLIVYLTARPDMQQRLVSAWLATHNFPHGLLFFTPSLSTEPLRQKAQFMKHLADIGLCIQAAYGSAKDIAVYANAGLDPERIFKVGANRRHRAGCISLENGYSTHLHDLHSGRIEIAQPAAYVHPFSMPASFQGADPPGSATSAGMAADPSRSGAVSACDSAGRRTPIQRTLSFGPRTGKYFCSKKISQASAVSSNY